LVCPYVPGLRALYVLSGVRCASLVCPYQVPVRTRPTRAHVLSGVRCATLVCPYVPGLRVLYVFTAFTSKRHGSSVSGADGNGRKQTFHEAGRMSDNTGIIALDFSGAPNQSKSRAVTDESDKRCWLYVFRSRSLETLHVFRSRSLETLHVFRNTFYMCIVNSSLRVLDLLSPPACSLPKRYRTSQHCTVCVSLQKKSRDFTCVSLQSLETLHVFRNTFYMCIAKYLVFFLTR
jgi:hypothetical protein